MRASSEFARGALCALLCLAFGIHLLSYAWVTEDAFITFRVVENALNGFGLRWNIDERVQVYTHPLWMLAHIPLQALLHHIFLTTTILSSVCTLAAFFWILASTPFSIRRMLFLLFLPILLSDTMRDFAMCGLETPMTWAVTGAFFFVLLRCRSRHWPNRHWLVFLLAALAVCTRLDNLLLLIPALVWHLIQHRKNIRLWELFVGWAPLYLWLGFSLLYYGFLFPNTKYAKLGTGLSREWHLQQGLAYGHNFMRYDFIACALMIACITGAYLMLRHRLIQRMAFHPTERCIALMAGGVALHACYVVWIGGDFMSGRFFAPGLYLTLYACYLWAGRSTLHTVKYAIALTGFVAMHHYWITPLDHTTNPFANRGIVNERLYWFASNSTFPHDSNGISLRRMPTDRLAHSGVAARYDQNLRGVTVAGNVGMYGYYAGPGLKIIDFYGLTDPLLARLPTVDASQRIGHFGRRVPAGYEEARRNGSLSMMTGPMAEYYRSLGRIISGTLWDPERLKMILRFQMDPPTPPAY